MHPARLALLAGRHAPRRAIVSKEFTPNGWPLVLECGHVGTCVAHATPGADWSCRACGEQIVRTAPQYANEFKE